MKTDNRYIISKGQIRYRVQSSEFRVQGSEFGVQDSEFRVLSSDQSAGRLNEIVGQACSYNKEYSTVQHSKQLVLNTFFSIPFPLHRGETPEGKGVKKASCCVASMHRREACVFNPSSCQLNGKPMDVELTIRAC